MSKAYSNKALPPGTVLREWRLEHVLGVGGFGIVYKGRGIYFDELVAIKEYFPSAISERDEDATVVPIDSDVEEVHALGLKKFVEEAKLLWNLSSPSRHPNIVSVRSLFEVHGTAYMVMDFEDGKSLSQLLKEGKTFDEQSLSAMILPVAEGLHRAHRVGVLHRDIKPGNIVVNEDGRSVLIDFGSARFESGEATSTSVTFHTPPYAALEQYVRTYEQGPWTDIYALGAVLYQCVTGEKPAEVLERMHGDAGTPMIEGDWPGYSERFLAAIDRAMTIHPKERPQSIPDWLDMFKTGGSAARPAPPLTDDESDDSTRIATFVDEPVKLAATVPVDAKPRPAPTPVSKSVEEPVAAAMDEPAEQPDRISPLKAEATALSAKRGASAAEEPRKKQVLMSRPVLMGSVAVALLAIIGGSWLLFGGSQTAESAPQEGIGGEFAEDELLPGELVEEFDSDDAGSAPNATRSPSPQAAARTPASSRQPTPSASRTGNSEVTFQSSPVVQSVGTSQPAQAAPQDGSAVTRDHRQRFDRVADDGDRLAREVIRMERSNRPGSNASADELQAYRIRQANAETARGYENYLDELRRYMRSVQNGADAEERIRQAEQTRTYLRDLQSASSATRQ